MGAAVKYLADANVLSEAAKPRPDAAVVDWLGRHESEIVVNPIVLGEVRYGILKLPAGKRRTRLQHWFEKGVATLGVLAIDAVTAIHWATLLAELKAKGRAMSVTDSLIAASARQHGLTVATRNVVDFRHAGVPIENPFEG